MFVSLSVLKLFVRIEVIAAVQALGGLVLLSKNFSATSRHARKLKGVDKISPNLNFSHHSTGGGVNLTQTYLIAAEGTIRHILCNIIEGTFKGGHQ